VNKVAKIGMAGWTILCFMGSCAGMMNIAHQTQGRELGGAESLGVGIGMFMWLIIWAVPHGGHGYYRVSHQAQGTIYCCRTPGGTCNPLLTLR